MAEPAKQIQGQDPKAKVFSDLYPILYSAETPVSASYVLSSWISAVHADVLSGGLRGKSVLDLGCGYGTTTAALANFNPRRIVAVDSSQAMIDLFQLVMANDADIEARVRSEDAREVLGDLCEKTVQHLKQRRAEFQNGIFWRDGGELVLKTMSSLELSPEKIGGYADVVVGNNFLHWPVNQKKAELKKTYPDWTDQQITEMAIAVALAAIEGVMADGATAVFMEPQDFMTYDDQPDRERDCDQHTMVSHPLFVKFHTIFNRLLKENHGIDRAVPKTSRLFLSSRLADLAEKSGLKMVRLGHCENSFNCDPVDAFYVRLPLVLGSLNLAFDQKIQLAKMAMEEFRREATSAERALPLQAQYFFWCLRKT